MDIVNTDCERESHDRNQSSFDEEDLQMKKRKHSTDSDSYESCKPVTKSTKVESQSPVNPCDDSDTNSPIAKIWMRKPRLCSSSEDSDEQTSEIDRPLCTDQIAVEAVTEHDVKPINGQNICVESVKLSGESASESEEDELPLCKYVANKDPESLGKKQQSGDESTNLTNEVQNQIDDFNESTPAKKISRNKNGHSTLKKETRSDVVMDTRNREKLLTPGGKHVNRVMVSLSRCSANSNNGLRKVLLQTSKKIESSDSEEDAKKLSPKYQNKKNKLKKKVRTLGQNPQDDVNDSSGSDSSTGSIDSSDGEVTEIKDETNKKVDKKVFKKQESEQKSQYDGNVSSDSVSSISSSDSSDGDDNDGASKKSDNKEPTNKVPKSSSASLSDKENISNKQVKKKTTEKSRQLQQLLKIQRASGIFVQYSSVFKGCTNQQKIKKIKEILHEAGMKGQPSLKKAEVLKLKKEAAELDTANIICSQGRSKRTGRIVQRQPSVLHNITPIKKKFSRLKDIIDSEDSSD